MALFVISLLSLSMVSALTADEVTFDTVRVNGDFVEFGPLADDEVLSIQEGQTVNIRVGLTSLVGCTDCQLEARIGGYEYSNLENLEDTSDLFDIQAGATKYVNLEIDLPVRLERDEYWLRLRVFDQSSTAIEETVRLAVEPARHTIRIADVAFSPGNTVMAGRSLLTTVLLENAGEDTEDDVKVTVSLPVLGVSATEFVDEVETDAGNVDFEDVPEMFLAIPATAQEGDYSLEVCAEYDRFRSTCESFSIHVLANSLFAPQDTLVLAVGPEHQTVAAGSTATYAVALTNAGPGSQAYVVEAVTGDWATASVSDSLVVLEAGKNAVVYVDVTAAADAVAGQHGVALAIKSGGETLETVSLDATVVPAVRQAAGQNVSLRNGLEIALIVLVVLLVIIGLIIGFSRLRKDDEEQTYY